MKKNLPTRSLVLAGLCLVATGCGEQPSPPAAPGMPTVGPPPAVISLDDNNEIQVDPLIVVLGPEETMTWQVQGATQTDQIRIHFAPDVNPGSNPGPFPPQTGEQRGTFSRQGSGNISTGPPDFKRTSAWKYDVLWTRQGGPPIRRDPILIIR